MNLDSELTSLRRRLNDFARQFDDRARKSAQDPARRKARSFHEVQDLFTRDITSEGLRDLVQRDTRDTFRFFTRSIDFETLRLMPWYKRYPLVVWRVFLGAAYRLNPPRRIAFAIAVATFLVGTIKFAASRASAPGVDTGMGWWFLSLALFFALLMMELRDKLDLKGDLEIAREIQFGLVPSEPVTREGFSICARMRPANTVGGDYYDIIELSDGAMGVVVGDVAGKGMPAALLMAMLQGSLRTLISAGFRGGRLIGKLNDYLVANIPANSLVTLFYGELETRNGALRYVNAGHNAPFLLRKDSCERLPSTGTVLGFFPGLPYEETCTTLFAGERLLLFTDGLSEAFNAADEEYSEARIQDFLQANRELSDRELIDGLIRSVLEFCSGTRPGDDMTLMTIARRPEPGCDLRA
jgi:hypothetical protein